MIYSHLGISKTLNFLGIRRFTRILKEGKYEKRSDEMYFSCGKKSDIIVAVQKKAFDEFIYIRSMIGCLVKLFEEHRVQHENIDNWEEWMILAGGKNTIRRGIYQHIFFNRLLDDVTKNELKVNDHDKKNIYHLLRWILQNYHILWAKDNLSMDNKRLRCNEYLGALMTAEVSKRINRLVSLGDKATLKEYLAIFRFPEDIFLTKLYSSGILRYSETNNDIDFDARIKYTKKGPNSLGGNDMKRIPIRQRLLHPSMMGYIDISASSTTDPGQSGELSPWNDMKSFYFDDSLTENELHFKLNQFYDKHPLDDDWCEVRIKCKDEDSFNKNLDKLVNYTAKQIRIMGTSIDPTEIIVEKDPREGYRKFDESHLVPEKEVTTTNEGVETAE